MQNKVNIFWFRRDLRLDDNVGLSAALNDDLPVVAIFIFDKEILSELSNKTDRRVDYIQQALVAINSKLAAHGSGVISFHDTVENSIATILSKFDVQAVYTNRDYEPYAIARDEKVKFLLEKQGIGFFDFKDQVIFEKDEVVKADNKPYTVYTPYSKRWQGILTKNDLKEHHLNFDNFAKIHGEVHSLIALGFKKSDLDFVSPILEESIVAEYDKYRDFPGLNLTSQLGIALRFGTISIRKCVRFGMQTNQTWLSELIWREFFMQILYHFPKVLTQSFKSQYDNIQWKNDESDFKRWCKGETGYPIVDAGMKQLNATGFMHNRVRMIVASFLCKHLLIDWRWGEAYFAEKLNDFDLSANNGNWQWAAGCGCDAAPYFRVFNPTAQTLKFDKDLSYTRRWNPDFETELTPPIIDHDFARKRVLEVYKNALKPE